MKKIFGIVPALIVLMVILSSCGFPGVVSTSTQLHCRPFAFLGMRQRIVI